MILHIPHASIDTIGKEFACDLRQELLRMTDRYTDELFTHKDAIRVVAPISRLICDMERFEDDALEVMAAKGMGVCYTINSFGKKLREVSLSEKAQIIETYYRPHHKALQEAVQRELDANGTALMIDCHSFSNISLPHEPDQNPNRSDICIGTDGFRTPQWLIESISMAFLQKGYSVKLNSPFEGTLVPMRFYRTEHRVYSVMIEINRDLYMDHYGEKNEKFESLKSDIDQLLDRLNRNLSLCRKRLK